MNEIPLSPPQNHGDSDLHDSRFLHGIPRRIVGRALALLAKAGVTEPLASLCVRDIQVHTPGGEGAVTVLAINSGRFRGDLEYLAGTGKFRILTVPFEWQGLKRSARAI